MWHAWRADKGFPHRSAKFAGPAATARTKFPPPRGRRGTPACRLAARRRARPLKVAEIAEKLAVRRQHHGGVVAGQAAPVGLHGTVETVEVRVLPGRFGVDL